MKTRGSQSKTKKEETEITKKNENKKQEENKRKVTKSKSHKKEVAVTKKRAVSESKLKPTKKETKPGKKKVVEAKPNKKETPEKVTEEKTKITRTRKTKRGEKDIETVNVQVEEEETKSPEENKEKMEEEVVVEGGKESKSKKGGKNSSSKKVKQNESQQEINLAPVSISTAKYQVGDGIWSKSPIKISSWNVNGIRAVLERNDLQKYIEESNPDILCLNETKIDEAKWNKENIASNFSGEYNQYWTFCKPPQSGYAGVCILSKVRPISYQLELNIHKHDLEGRTITLEYDKFYLVSCYVPNAGQKLVRLDYRVNEWDVDFRNYLNTLKQKKPVILCGDLNVAHHEIDIFNPKGNLKSAGFTIQEREQFTKLLNDGFVDTFRQRYPDKVQYSYWAARSKAREENKGWRLDYFIINQEAQDLYTDSIIRSDVKGSDHCPIELTLDVNKSL